MLIWRVLSLDEIDVIFKRSFDTLDDVEFNFNNGSYNVSINRSY